MVLDLRAELQRVKDAAKKAAWVAKETTKVAVTASYECGVEETEKRLAKKVAEVCRKYYTESWIEALNNAGVPADSELRKVERLFFPEHIREAPTNLPPTTVLSLECLHENT